MCTASIVPAGMKTNLTNVFKALVGVAVYGSRIFSQLAENITSKLLVTFRNLIIRSLTLMLT